MSKYTHDQIADSYSLWVEYFDTSGNMDEEEFDSMPHTARVALLRQAFGDEDRGHE